MHYCGIVFVLVSAFLCYLTRFYVFTFYKDGGDKGKRVPFDFELYEDVDAAYIQHLLDHSFPVALRLHLDPKFTSNKGEVSKQVINLLCSYYEFDVE